VVEEIAHAHPGSALWFCLYPGAQLLPRSGPDRRCPCCQQAPPMPLGPRCRELGPQSLSDPLLSPQR
jgi:hypothetical protein